MGVVQIVWIGLVQVWCFECVGNVVFYYLVVVDVELCVEVGVGVVVELVVVVEVQVWGDDLVFVQVDVVFYEYCCGLCIGFVVCMIG